MNKRKLKMIYEIDEEFLFELLQKKVILEAVRKYLITIQEEIDAYNQYAKDNECTIAERTKELKNY